MADKLQNRVGELVTGPPTADVNIPLTLAGALVGLQTFADGFDLAGGIETDVPAVLTTGNTWQTGLGTFDSAAGTFTFNVIEDSSAGGSAISVDEGSELRCTAVASTFNSIVGAQPTNLGNVPAPASVTITSSTGGNTAITPATDTSAGVMSAAQVGELQGKADQSALNSHTADATVHFTQGNINHQTINGAGVNTHAQIDSHIGDGTIHKTEAQIVHDNLSGAGTNSHANLDAHLADGTIHKTDAQVDHLAIQNRGVTTHAQLDAHVADGTIHKTEGEINHQALTGAGTNTHAAIDSHIADATIHKTDAQIVHDNLSGAGTNSHAQLDAHVADNGIHVPGGGTAGQVLQKASNTSGDTEWGPGGSGGHTIQDEGVALPQRDALNFRGPGVTVTDDLANDRTNVDFSRGYETIQNDGLALPEETILNFTDGLDAVDDAGASRTNVTVRFGTGATDAVRGNDVRLSDARDPNAHAASHASGGSDPLSHTALGDIGTLSHPQLEVDLAQTVRLTGSQTIFDRKTFRGLEFGASGTENLMPVDRGSPGQVLETDGGGQLTWADKATITQTGYTSDATSDLEANYYAGWNEYADRNAVSRTSNEIIYWTWPSSGGVVYQYLGNQQSGPWLTAPADWLEIGSAVTFANFPLDFTNSAVGVAIDPAGGNQAYLEKHAGAGAQTVTPAVTFAAVPKTTVDPALADDLVRKGHLDIELAGKKDDFAENTGFNLNLGATAGTVVEGNDARLSDARTPTAHAAEHAAIGSDPINHVGLLNAGTNTHAQLDAHLADTGIHFAMASIDHDAIANNGLTSHADLDAHVGNAGVHFTEASIVHQNISGAGTNTHAQIDAHIGDATLHFTVGSIDHQAITGAGLNTHAQIDTHIGDATLHYAQAAIDHIAIQNIGVNTHVQIDAHIDNGNLHYQQADIDHNAISNRGTLTHAELETELNARIKAVVDDPAPVLGGNLDSDGKQIVLKNSLGTIVGAVGNTPDDANAYIAHLNPDGIYDPNDGGVQLVAGGTILRGSNAAVQSLAGSAQQQVYVDNNGIFYGVAPPAPGWSHTDTDNGDYALGVLGAWEQLFGLVGIVQQDVQDGDRLDLFVNVWCENDSLTRAGTVELGFSVNGGPPITSVQSFVIAPGFAGYLVASLATTSHGGLTASDTIEIYGQRASQEHPQFEPYLRGSVNTHELITSVPSSSGGGGNGTNLGTTLTATTATITSDTGTNATIPAAISGTAGVMTGAQVDSLTGKLDQTGGTIDPGLASNTVSLNVKGHNVVGGGTANWFEIRSNDDVIKLNVNNFGTLFVDGTDVNAHITQSDGFHAPMGGAQGEALVKNTSADGDFIWGSVATDLTDAVFPTSATFDAAFAASAAVDFANGNKQTIADASGLSITLAAPGVGSFILDLASNSDLLTQITTPVLWDSGTVPTWAGRSVIAFYYDGTTWFGSAMTGVS